jgi:hypothetical protein
MNKNNNKLYHAASLAQRELEPVLNAITNKVCEDYESFRPCPPIESMHELIILVIDTVFLVVAIVYHLLVNLTQMSLPYARFRDY